MSNQGSNMNKEQIELRIAQAINIAWWAVGILGFLTMVGILGATLFQK